MKKIFYAAAFLLLTGVFSACNNDKETEGGDLSFKFPLTQYEATKLGGKKIIGFSTAKTWEAEVKYAIAPTSETDGWIEFSPKSGGAGNWFLTLNLDENAGADDRNAEIVIKSGDETKILKISQLATSSIVPKETTIEVKEAGGLVDVPINTNRSCYITVPDDIDWITIPESKTVTKDTVLQVFVETNSEMGPRSCYISIHEKVENASMEAIKRTVEIVQTGDRGYFIYEGVNTKITPSSVVANGNQAFKAYYMFANKSQTGLWAYYNYSATGEARDPVDISGGNVGMRFMATSAFKHLQVNCPTWNDGNGGGKVTAKLYVWDTDYATSTKGAVLSERYTEYKDNADVPCIADGLVLPAGEYLVVLSSTHSQSGVWVVNNKASVELPVLDNDWKYFFNGATQSGKVVLQGKIEYVESSKAGAAYYNLNDQAKNVGKSDLYYVNKLWLSKNIAPSDMRVAAAGGDTYMLFDNAGKDVYVARLKDQKVWDGSTWNASDLEVVWSDVTPVSVVENGGTMYLYAMQDGKLLVRTAPAGENWVAGLSGSSEAYAFTAKIGVDVKYIKGQFVATYIQKNQICRLVSADGKVFTDEGVLYAKTYDKPASARYVSGVTGDINYLTYLCNQGWYLKIIE